MEQLSVSIMFQRKFVIAHFVWKFVKLRSCVASATVELTARKIVRRKIGMYFVVRVTKTGVIFIVQKKIW